MTMLHQVRKDLQYIRWPLALWLILLAAWLAVPLLQLDRRMADWRSTEKLAAIQAVIALVTTAFSWVLAVRIVHADPLDGTTAFWLTRPLGAGTLFLAKTGLVFTLFVLLPGAARALGAGASGVHGTALLQVWAEATLLGAVFVTLFLAAAALTRDAARLVLLAIPAALAWIVVHTLTATFGYPDGSAVIDRTLARLSGVLVALVTTLVVGLVIVRHQFLTRRTRRSVALASTLAAVVPLAALWPWNLLGTSRPVDPRLVNLSSVGVSVTDSWAAPGVAKQAAEGRGANGVVRVFARVAAEGLPPGWSALPTECRGRLTFPDGVTAAFGDDTQYAGWFTGYDSYLAQLTPVRHALAAHLRATWLNPPNASTRSSVVVAAVPSAVYRDHLSAVGDYEARVTFAVFKPGDMVSVPLRSGSSGRAGGVQLTVLGVEHKVDPGTGDSVRVESRSTWPSLLIPRQAPGVAYLVMNRRRADGIVFGVSAVLGGAVRGLIFSTGATVARRTLVFGGSARAPLALPEHWMDDAELVMVALEPAGTFTKTIHLPGFTLPK